MGCRVEVLSGGEGWAQGATNGHTICYKSVYKCAAEVCLLGVLYKCAQTNAVLSGEKAALEP